MNFLFNIFATLILLASSITKLIFIEHIVFSLVESSIFNWEIAPIAISTIVIIEFIIAISLLLKSIHTKLLSLSILLLCGFYLIDFFGKPIDGLYANEFTFFLFNKWITLAGVFYLIIFAISPKKQSKKNSLSRLKNMTINFCLVVIIGIPLFIINPIYIDDFQKHTTSIENPNLNWENVYEKCLDSDIAVEPEVFFAFLSTSCYYCNRAAIKLGVSKRAKLNSTQIVLVFPGNRKDTEAFIEKNKCDFPYIRISKDEFRKIAGNEFPAFFKVKDKKETNYYTGRTFNFRELDKLFQLE